MLYRASEEDVKKLFATTDQMMVSRKLQNWLVDVGQILQMGPYSQIDEAMMSNLLDFQVEKRVGYELSSGKNYQTILRQYIWAYQPANNITWMMQQMEKNINPISIIFKEKV